MSLSAAAGLAGSRAKRISAMVRVRDEVEFLCPSVRSIAPLVDELVIIDNMSTDGTRELIAELQTKLPGVRTFSYPHRIARVGSEFRQTVSADGAGSPRLEGEFNNWCLRRCSFPFVLKWDADMLAGPALTGAMAQWRAERYVTMWFKGLNVHPDRTHLVGARSNDRALVGSPLSGAAVPGWLLTMTTAPGESRLFPRLGARYGVGRCWWTAEFRSPFQFGVGAPARWPGTRLKLAVEAPLYLHLKFCKRQPHANHSADFAAAVRRNVTTGPVIPPEWREVLERYELLKGRAPSAPRSDRDTRR